VHGVLRHERTATKARDLCAVRGVTPEDRPVWEALEHDDELAIGFARLLLWSDPRLLPTNETEAWDTYIRNWRPGKPHRNRWHGNYGPASRAVRTVQPAPDPALDTKPGRSETGGDVSMNAWQLMLAEKLVQIAIANSPDPREAVDHLIDWAQAEIKASPNKLDDLALPILRELESSFGDPSD